MKLKLRRFDILKTFIKVIIGFSIIFAAELLIIHFVEKNYNKEENLITVNGIVTEVTIDSDESKLFIMIDTYDNQFYGLMKKEEISNLSEVIQINDYVEILVSIKRLDNEKIPIKKLQLNGIDLVDLTDDAARTNQNMFIIGIILIMICVIGAVTLILLNRKDYFEEVDYFEHVLPFTGVSFINKKRLSKKQTEKRNIKYVFIYLGFMLLLIIGIAVFGSLYPDYPHVIIPIVVVLFLLGTYLLFKLTVLYKPSKEDIKEFVKLYKQYISGKIDFGITVKKQPFNKQGYVFKDCLVYEDEDEEEVDLDNPSNTIIPYEKLDLYVICLFRNNYHFAHIFICSDCEEFVSPFFFELDPINYKQIIDLKIPVRNLDYILENVENEINKHKPKLKHKVIKYK